jgi:hypothetical protein
VSTPPAFPHRLAGHCGSGALRDLLELHELDYGDGPLSEGFAFGLGGGVGFLYVELPGTPTPAYLVGRTADLETDVTRTLEIGLDIRETDDPAEGWAWVKDAIDSGHPPMVWADIAELEYLRVKMTNTRHDIVIAGYDEDEQIAWVADNDREELQRCSLDSLARARSSNGFPGPNRHRVFLYDWPRQLRPPHDAIRAALQITLDNMNGGGTRLGQLAGMTGLEGVDAFCTAYPQWPERFGDELETALDLLSALIVKAGTGGALFRSLQAEFLHDSAALLEQPVLAAAAGAYDQLAAAWVELAGVARAHEHAAGLSLVSRIATLEHDATDALQEALTAL